MIYWISTALVCGFLSLSAWSYIFHQPTIIGIAELGFPNFFRIQLAILKLLAAIVILIPAAPLLAKDWAYAGTVLFLITAIVAHVAHNDSHFISVLNIALIALAITSSITLRTA